MYRYYPVLEERYPEPQDHSTYHIVAEQLVENHWVQVAFVPDVSCERSTAADIAERCTRGQLSPLHLIDAIIDLLE